MAMEGSAHDRSGYAQQRHPARKPGHPPGATRNGNIIRIGVDVLEFLPPLGEYAFCAGFPPCTDMAVSGAPHGSADAKLLLELSASFGTMDSVAYFRAIPPAPGAVPTSWKTAGTASLSNKAAASGLKTGAKRRPATAKSIPIGLADEAAAVA